MTGMPAATVPPAPGDPGFLGPYRVLGRRAPGLPAAGDRWAGAVEVGSVLVGAGADGRRVDLVRLGPGPSSDAAARDRFAAAVRELADRRPGSVPAADLNAPGPWAAVQPDDAMAGRLLAAAAGPAGAETATGPQFAPHWLGTDRYPVPHRPVVAGLPADNRTWRWVLIAVLVLVLWLLLLWWLLARDAGPVPRPLPTLPLPTATLTVPTPTSDGRSGTSPTPSPTTSGTGPGRLPGLTGTPRPTVPARFETGAGIAGTAEKSIP